MFLRKHINTEAAVAKYIKQGGKVTQCKTAYNRNPQKSRIKKTRTYSAPIQKHFPKHEDTDKSKMILVKRENP